MNSSPSAYSNRANNKSLCGCEINWTLTISLTSSRDRLVNSRDRCVPSGSVGSSLCIRSAHAHLRGARAPADLTHALLPPDAPGSGPKSVRPEASGELQNVVWDCCQHSALLNCSPVESSKGRKCHKMYPFTCSQTFPSEITLRNRRRRSQSQINKLGVLNNIKPDRKRSRKPGVGR